MTPVTQNKRKLRIVALHVRLERDRKVVRMHVLKQAFSDGYTRLYSSGFPVDSCSYPELDSDRIWLRGRDKTENNSVANISFGTIKQAKAYYTNLIRTFETIEIRYE